MQGQQHTSDNNVYDGVQQQHQHLQVVYMCSSLLQLAHGSRDLSQAKKEITACKAEKIHKMTTISLKMTTLFIKDDFECQFFDLLSFT